MGLTDYPAGSERVKNRLPTGEATDLMMNSTPCMDRGSRTEVDFDHMPLLLQALQHRALPGVLAATRLHRRRSIEAQPSTTLTVRCCLLQERQE